MATQKYWDGTQWIEVGLSSVDQARIVDTQGKVVAINSSVGATTDVASATGSVNAKLKDIKASVGATTDVASITGSVNAKLKDLSYKAIAAPVFLKSGNLADAVPNDNAILSFTSSVSGTSVLKVTGRGRLLGYGHPNGGYWFNVRIDGGLILNLSRFSAGILNIPFASSFECFTQSGDVAPSFIYELY